MPAVPSVLLVDPDEAAREEVRRLLSVAGLAVVAHCGYGPEAVRLLQQTGPAAVAMAARGVPQRVEAMLERMRRAAPGTPVLLYGMPSFMARAMALGARACLPDRPGDALPAAIREVLALEQRLRSADSGPHAGGAVVTVVSARGGVGKTTVAAGLAAALHARLELSTALIDCDPYGGAAGLLPRDRGAPPVLPPSSLEEAQQLAAVHDWVVVDTAAGLRDEALRSLELCDIALLVTTPDVAVLREHVRAMRQLSDWGFPQDRLLVVLDRTHPSHSAPAAEVARALDCAIVADIPYDRRLRRLADEGVTPVLTSAPSPAARSLVELASRLAGVALPSSSRRGPISLLLAAIRPRGR